VAELRQQEFLLATGYFFNINQPLTEKWNGSGWRTLSSPFQPVHRVSCVSSSFCMAVGSTYATNFQTRIEKWNGSSWSIVSSPNTAPLRTPAQRRLVCEHDFCIAAELLQRCE